MSKLSTPISLSTTTYNYLSTKIGISKSTYTESLILSDAFENGFIPNQHETNDLILNFSPPSSSNITVDFRSQLSTLPLPGQHKVLKLLYNLNLINGYKISTEKMANIFKHDEICYFALGNIGRGRKYVNEYIESFSLPTFTLGSTTAPNNEYLFFSNLQQFKLSKSYPLFARLVAILGISTSVNVIRVHYLELDKIIDAIKLI